MSTISAPTFLSPLLRPVVETDADCELPLRAKQEPSREAWQTVIDQKLIDWRSNAGQFDDEEIESPSRETIGIAIEIAHALQRQGRAAPTRVVPDARGGIVFERGEGHVFETIRVGPGHQVEYCLFHDSRLVRSEYW